MRFAAFLGAAVALMFTASIALSAETTVDVPTGPSETVTIPRVESWKEINPTAQAAVTGTGLRHRAYKDPAGNGLEGITLAHKDKNGVERIFIRGWNLKTVSAKDMSRAKIALELDNGMWVIGDPGETLHVMKIYDNSNDWIGSEFYFKGAHKGLGRRTITFGKPIST